MKARFDLYVRYTVEIDIANFFRTLEELNQACNHHFVFVLREYFPNLMLYGCLQLPGSGGPPAIPLRTQADLTAYHQRMPQGPIYEIHIPDSKMGQVAGFYSQQLDNQQLQISRLTEQITSLRQQGQGLSQGFSFLQQVAPVRDEQVVTVVQQQNQGIVPCITAMQGSPQDVWTNVQGLRCIMLYGAESPERMQEISHTNGLTAVITAMKAFPQDVMTQQYANHICAEAAQYSEHRTQLHTLGAVEPIIINLGHFPSDVLVQSYGCWALSNLADNPEYRSEIVQLKGVEAIVSALKHHPQDPNVVRYAFCALQPMAWQPDVAMQIVRFEGVPAIVQTLQHQQHDHTVAYHGIRTLAELAKQPETRAQLANYQIVPIVLSTMRSFAQDRSVQESGLMCLATLAVGNEVNQHAIFHNQGIPYVVNALRTYQGSTESDAVGLVHQGTYLLANLASQVECRQQICQSQGVETVIQIMRANPQHVGTQHQALRVISGLAASREAMTRLISSGSVEAVLTSMRTLPSEVDVQLHGCYAIGQLAQPQEIKVRLNPGGMTVLLQALQYHPHDQYVQEQAAAALAIICELDPAKEAMTNLKVADQGHEVSACSLICRSIKTMHDHPATIKQVLKLTALVALVPSVKLLVVEGPPPSYENILQTLKLHGTADAAVTYYCLKAMAALAHPQPEPQYAQSCAEFVEPIVLSMKHFYKDVRIQETGCEVISKLALLEELQDAIRVKGVIGAICIALKNFEADQGIQRKGCRALANIAEHEESRIEIRNQGGIKCVVQSMRYHVAHPEALAAQGPHRRCRRQGGAPRWGTTERGCQFNVGEQGCAAIANLALNQQNRIEVANSDGVKAVIAGLKMHQSHPGIQAYGLGALGNLAVHEDNCRVILQAGAIQMVIHAMRQWPGEARVQHFACVALSNFAHDDGNKVAIGNAGGNHLVIDAMRRHPDHVGVQEQGCGALANLGIHANNMNEIAKLNGIEIVVGALKRHPQHKGVQENASFALSKFLAMPNENYRQRMKTAGAEQALISVRDGQPPPDFDVRICVNVLLRRLTEEAPEGQQHNQGQQQQQQQHQQLGKDGFHCQNMQQFHGGAPQQQQHVFAQQGQWGPPPQGQNFQIRPNGGAMHIQHVQQLPAMPPQGHGPPQMFVKGKGKGKPCY